jgi:hypothetical protein
VDAERRTYKTRRSLVSTCAGSASKVINSAQINIGESPVRIWVCWLVRCFGGFAMGGWCITNGARSETSLLVGFAPTSTLWRPALQITVVIQQAHKAAGASIGGRNSMKWIYLQFGSARAVRKRRQWGSRIASVYLFPFWHTLGADKISTKVESRSGDYLRKWSCGV